MKLWVFALGTLLVAAPTLAEVGAQPSVAEPSAITAVIDDLNAGRSDLAVKRIAAIESISGRPKLVSSPLEFVQRLKGCKVTERRPRPPLPSSTYQFEVSDWTCQGGPIRVTFAVVANEPFVTVAEFSDTARLQEAMRIAPPTLPPLLAPPPPLTPAEQAATAERNAMLRGALGKAVMTGKIDQIQGAISPATRFTYGLHVPGLRTEFLEKDGLGINSGRDILGYSRKQLGVPSNFECKHEGEVDSCVWHFASGDRVLLAFPLFDREGHFVNVAFKYATREKVLEAQRAANVPTGGQ